MEGLWQNDAVTFGKKQLRIVCITQCDIIQQVAVLANDVHVSSHSWWITLSHEHCISSNPVYLKAKDCDKFL